MMTVMKRFIIKNKYETTISVSTYMFLLIATLAIVFLATALTPEDFCSSTAAEAIKKKEAMTCPEYWLNRYQSIIGGILALVGAFLAWSAVRSQIAQTERHTEERRTRQAYASSAAAVLTLHQLTKYQNNIINILKLHMKMRINNHPLSSISLPDLPRDEIAVLKEYIEFADPAVSKQAGELIFGLQIQSSRLEALSQEAMRPSFLSLGANRIQHVMFDAVDIFSQISNLFPLIRDTYPHRTYKIARMYETVMIAELEGPEWDYVHAAMKRIDEEYKTKNKPTIGRSI